MQAPQFFPKNSANVSARNTELLFGDWSFLPRSATKFDASSGTPCSKSTISMVTLKSGATREGSVAAFNKDSNADMVAHSAVLHKLQHQHVRLGWWRVQG
mmetsp:Transcript_24200/g.60575  ORF Transcript_24200/g.60575 Transcript_24200/m.60575 type:complete len:100 (-) Transcript_24200:2-301(-)